mmetsp:Transcript_135405/g.234843  ORF Transcript_135405/g.234843 Transcript_135405/m.234843 type:complete len:270 (-) Transcript_135405:1172-1981(-)
MDVWVPVLCCVWVKEGDGLGLWVSVLVGRAVWVVVRGCVRVAEVVGVEVGAGVTVRLRDPVSVGVAVWCSVSVWCGVGLAVGVVHCWSGPKSMIRRRGCRSAGLGVSPRLVLRRPQTPPPQRSSHSCRAQMLRDSTIGPDGLGWGLKRTNSPDGPETQPAGKLGRRAQPKGMPRTRAASRQACSVTRAVVPTGQLLSRGPRTSSDAHSQSWSEMRSIWAQPADRLEWTHSPCRPPGHGTGSSLPPGRYPMWPTKGLQDWVGWVQCSVQL